MSDENDLPSWADRDGHGNHITLERGTKFDVEGTPDETWEHIWERVRSALAAQGFTALRVVRKKKLHGMKTERWYNAKMVCQYAGRKRNNPKSTDPALRRERHSKKIDCPFKVCITWSEFSAPEISHVCLKHAERCIADNNVELKGCNERKCGAKDGPTVDMVGECDKECSNRAEGQRSLAAQLRYYENLVERAKKLARKLSLSSVSYQTASSLFDHLETVANGLMDMQTQQAEVHSPPEEPHGPGQKRTRDS